MSPFIPHFTAECLKSIDQKQVKWPIISKDELIDEETNIVVQINGKKRGLLKVKRDVEENKVLNEIKSNPNIEKFLQNKKIIKTIFVSNRLINIIL